MSLSTTVNNCDSEVYHNDSKAAEEKLKKGFALTFTCVIQNTLPVTQDTFHVFDIKTKVNL